MLKTVKEVEARIKAGKPGADAVGDGAYLNIAKGGTATWIFRYNGRWMGLGPYSLLSLAEAREKAREARRLRLDGIDPLETKLASVARRRLLWPVASPSKPALNATSRAR